MRFIEVSRTQYKLSDFISWQRAGTLSLSPSFQRRPVWKPEAKSFLVDTVVRGLPIPVIYVRERLNIDSQETIREIVDGQQRLRTLFGYVNPNLLSDYSESQDYFTVKKLHNPDIADIPFGSLPSNLQKRILNYQFSSHVLPSGIEDREVLQIFARLNATGVKLNRQELRNAEFYGELKTLMYTLSLEQLDGWRAWGVLTESQIARMKEVEVTSDIVMNMVSGLTGKTQTAIDTFYRDNDESFPKKKIVSDRFRKLMKVIDELMRGPLQGTIYTSEVHFFSLCVYIYDCMWGLGSPLVRRTPSKLSRSIPNCLIKVSQNFRSEKVPKTVLDAVQRASADLGRRQKRLKYMHRVCNA